MRFLPTIDLWANGVTVALRAGQLRLQRGQWVRCGTEGEPSRFVAVREGGSIWVAHSEGRAKTTESFKRLCSIA